MASRPTWSGSIQISLVSIGVKIFPATNPGRQVEFHMIDRKTHKRVHHQNVDEAGSVEKDDIVKGFEYAKDKYVEIDPEELKDLRLQTTTTMPITQFVKSAELSPVLFDRAYFVIPDDDIQANVLGIMRKALTETGTLGIGEIAFSGREHLVAIGAPVDPKQKGLMLYLLRYEDELRNPSTALAGVKESSTDTDGLSLAKQLINGKTSKFDPSAYKDDYEAAVRKLVAAKRKGKPLPQPEPEPAQPKVASIMDALRSSLSEEKKPKKAVSKNATRRKNAA
jgi:DNA end-binding protein Ku